MRLLCRSEIQKVRYLFIDLLVDEGIAKLRCLKSFSTDDQSHQFVLKCPKVSCTRYHIL